MRANQSVESNAIDARGDSRAALAELRLPRSVSRESFAMKTVTVALLVFLVATASGADSPRPLPPGADPSYSMKKGLDAIGRHTEGAKQYLTLNLVNPPDDKIVAGLLQQIEFCRKKKIWFGVATPSEDWAVDLFTRALTKKPKLKLEGLRMVIITPTGESTRFVPLFEKRGALVRFGSYKQEGEPGSPSNAG